MAWPACRPHTGTKPCVLGFSFGVSFNSGVESKPDAEGLEGLKCCGRSWTLKKLKVQQIEQLVRFATCTRFDFVARRLLTYFTCHCITSVFLPGYSRMSRQVLGSWRFNSVQEKPEQSSTNGPSPKVPTTTLYHYQKTRSFTTKALGNSRLEKNTSHIKTERRNKHLKFLPIRDV